MDYLVNEAESLENKATELRKEYAIRKRLQEYIKIGAIIFDTEAKKYAKVVGLARGCIDFSATYLDNSYSRGYLILSHNNWRPATLEEAR